MGGKTQDTAAASSGILLRSDVPVGNVVCGPWLMVWMIDGGESNCRPVIPTVRTLPLAVPPGVMIVGLEAA